ncbi:MAG: hypothetical protein AAB890_02290 [Patescibacteria group bacterium]
MSEEKQSKISGLEATILVLTCAFFDFLDLLATFVNIYFGVGEAIKLMINFIISPILWFWITMRGVRSDWVLYGGLLEMIPIFGNTLPIRTVTMIVVIYMDWHPKTDVAVKIATGTIKSVGKK